MIEGMVIDCFAGGGGASQGIEEALGRPCDVAVNHDPKAIAMHRANHPMTHHITEDIWSANLEGYVAGRHVGLMWASPDCTHFSRAKGGKPRESRVRMLPWSVHMHAKNLQPDVIIMENVAEIQTWGPLGDDGRPIKAGEGKEYARFVDHMRDIGYTFDCRELVAADFGAPTTRKRWYAILRRDGRRTVWPERDHAPSGDPSGLDSYVPAASVIDWSLPCPSVFAARSSIKEVFGVNAVRPLAGRTLRRIARGLDRYVVSCDAPLIVRRSAPRLPVNNSGTLDARPEELSPTIATRGHKMAVARPAENPADGLISMAYITSYYGGPHGGSVGQHAAAPLRTITTSSGAHFGLVTAYLIQTGFYGARVASGADELLHTETASGTHFGVARPHAQNSGRWLEVRALLNEHCEYGLRDDEVLVAQIDGASYCISDIGMRMLTPEELKLAQGFPADYVIDRYYDGTPVTKTQQVRMIGNSVVPVMARRLVEANM